MEQAPPPVLHISEDILLVGRGRPLRRTYAVLGNARTFISMLKLTVLSDINDINADAADLIFQHNVLVRTNCPKTISSLLELSDSQIRPGVTKAEFRMLFARCNCSLTLTCDISNQHRCSKEIIDLTEEEVIDLTQDDD
jgi:hypothetical protein